LVVGRVTADISIQFLERIRQQWARLGYPIRAIVADNGPEHVATKFADALARAEITRIKIPARSPNHNAVRLRTDI
jgi:transposase InsO family protein